MVDFHGFHVGKYTSPTDPMGVIPSQMMCTIVRETGHPLELPYYLQMLDLPEMNKFNDPSSMFRAS